MQTWFFRIHTQARLRRRALKGLRLVQTGGASRDRTDDLMLAKQPLSQLSYGPNRECGQIVVCKWWAWDDSNVRPHPYQGCALTT